ncbi:MAG: hypothetical protein SFV51_08415 [Bryobacteraceae bacterium]|nr:hypothetical protein [Bryobacteraceae bacterium]
MNSLILLLLSWPLPAADYTFHKIIDTAPGSEYSSFKPHLILNNEGVVALTATRRRDGQQVLLRGTPGAMSVLVEESDEVRAPVAADMNDSGAVVYFAGASVRTTTGSGPSRVVATGRGPDFLFINLGITAFPSINNDGAVAFTASNRVYVAANGEAPRMVVSETDIPRWFANTPAQLSGVRINNRGVIAFHALGTANPAKSAVYLKGEGPPVLALPFETIWTPFSDDGSMALYSRVFRDGVAITREGVLANAVTFDDETAGLSTALGMSNSGNLVFLADASDGSAKASGIFTGGDLERHGVIAVGDPLFGSTVAHFHTLIGYQPRLINDRGQILFSYTLSNFVSGVALADPVGEVAPGAPVIYPGGIRNTALPTPATERGAALAPGTAISIYGRNFAPRLEIPERNSQLPSSLGGVAVTFNGIEAPVFFAAQGQVDVLVPYELQGATTAEVKVFAAGGESGPVTVNIAPHSPAIYRILESGSARAVYTGTETLVLPIGATPDSRPARPGDRISIFANGLGGVTPELASGANSCPDSVCEADDSNVVPRHAAVKPVVQIGGTALPEDNVHFAGLDARTPGFFRIDFTLPAGLPSGAQPMVIRQGNFSSPERTVVISLR